MFIMSHSTYQNSGNCMFYDNLADQGGALFLYHYS
jgi:hypothetical protein